MFSELNSFARVHRFAFAGPAPRIDHGRHYAVPPPCVSAQRRDRTDSRLPPRPDASVISEAIPLFYIGRNKNGLWVAREAEGRIGGMFLTRRAAVRFANESCKPAGCATMFVTQPLELDFTRSDKMAEPRHGAAAAKNPPLLLVVWSAAVVAVRRLFGRLSRVLASERSHRRTIERDLFGGRYVLCSKNDDDFPIAP